MHRILLVALASVLLVSAANAEGYQRLGYGRIITNDMFGDGKDRWRTGSLQSSRVWGRGWNGRLPAAPGDLVELRFNLEIAAPAGLNTPDADDRRFAGVLGLGVYTHYAVSGLEFSLGGGVETVGPQTNLDEAQGNLHRLLGADDASDSVRDDQIGDMVTAYGQIEVGHRFDLGRHAEVRPFFEARAGIETYARVGADFEFGQIARDQLRARDHVSGHAYTTVRGAETGLSVLVGGDVAKVAHSAILPDYQGYELTDERTRVRSALQWRGERSLATFGVTYLGKEFEAQDEGQVLGSLRIKYDF